MTLNISLRLKISLPRRGINLKTTTQYNPQTFLFYPCPILFLISFNMMEHQVQIFYYSQITERYGKMGLYFHVSTGMQFTRGPLHFLFFLLLTPVHALLDPLLLQIPTSINWKPRKQKIFSLLFPTVVDTKAKQTKQALKNLKKNPSF